MGMQPSSRARLRALATLRLTGAIALLATGGIHLEQYLFDDYRVVPTIGPLFLLNFAGGAVLGLYFLVPSAGSPGVLRRSLDLLAAWGGLALAAGSLVALFISESTPLFGFMEQGYRLEVLIAIVAEAVAVLALTALMALGLPGPRWTVPATPLGEGGPLGHGPAGDLARRRNGSR
jgi:hypothetical protein